MVEQKELFECKPEFDSKEELLFHYYLEELKAVGLIEYAEYQPKTFDLIGAVTKTVRLEGKKKNPFCDVPLFKSKHYTADWKIKWTEQANKHLIWTQGDTLKGKPTQRTASHPEQFIPFYHEGLVTYVDIKGGAGSFFGRSNNSAITFTTNQKWVYDKFGIYVQKVVITLDKKGLFARTFTPKQVIVDEKYKTNKAGKWEKGDSKLKYSPIILEEYMRIKGIEYDRDS